MVVDGEYCCTVCTPYMYCTAGCIRRAYGGCPYWGVKIVAGGGERAEGEVWFGKGMGLATVHREYSVQYSLL